MNHWSKLLIGLSVALAVLAALEGAARLFEDSMRPDRKVLSDPGWQVSFFRGLFDWHEPDPELLWRFRPNLDNALITTNGQHTIGPEVAAKKPGTFRILVVGDSSPVGLGLSSWRETFPSLLERHLAMTEDSGGQVEVINAAVSGYSSEQVKRFVELRAGQLKPDAMIVYCGSNDASISSSLADREVFESARLVHVRGFCYQFALYRLLSAILRPSPGEPTCDEQEPVVRVPQESYRENLEAIVTWGREHDCHVYLCLPAVPLLWPAGLQFKVFQRTRDVDGDLLLPEALRAVYEQDLHYCLSAEQFARLYGHGDRFTRSVYALGLTDTTYLEEGDISAIQEEAFALPDPAEVSNIGVRLWQNGRPKKAFRVMMRACSLAVDNLPLSAGPLSRSRVAPFLFNAGICRLSMDHDTAVTAVPEASEAKLLLDSALNADFLSLRIKRSWAETVRIFEGQPGVTVIDVPEIFRANGGESLFLDHCHPTARGHRLIAEHLRQEIRKRMYR